MVPLKTPSPAFSQLSSVSALPQAFFLSCQCAPVYCMWSARNCPVRIQRRIRLSTRHLPLWLQVTFLWLSSARRLLQAAEAASEQGLSLTKTWERHNRLLFWASFCRLWHRYPACLSKNTAVASGSSSETEVTSDSEVPLRSDFEWRMLQLVLLACLPEHLYSNVCVHEFPGL